MSNTEIIKGGYEAFARGDGADLFSRFASDIEWTTPAGSPRGLGGVYKGHEEVQGFFGKVLNAYGEGMAVRPEEFVAAGDRLIVLGTLQAQVRLGWCGHAGFRARLDGHRRQGDQDGGVLRHRTVGRAARRLTSRSFRW